MVALLRFCAAALLASVGDGVTLKAIRMHVDNAQLSAVHHRDEVTCGSGKDCSVQQHIKPHQREGNVLALSLLQAGKDKNDGNNTIEDETSPAAKSELAVHEADDFPTLLEFFNRIVKIREAAEAIQVLETNTKLLDDAYLASRAQQVFDLPQVVAEMSNSAESVLRIFLDTTPEESNVSAESKPAKGKDKTKTKGEDAKQPEDANAGCKRYHFTDETGAGCRALKTTKMRMDIELAALSVEVGTYAVGLADSDLVDAIGRFVMAASAFGLAAAQNMSRCDSLNENEKFYNYCHYTFWVVEMGASVFQSKQYDEVDGQVHTFSLNPGKQVLKYSVNHALQSTILNSDKKRHRVETALPYVVATHSEDSSKPNTVVKLQGGVADANPSDSVAKTLKLLALARLSGWEFLRSGVENSDLHFNHRCVDGQTAEANQQKLVGTFSDWLASINPDEQLIHLNEFIPMDKANLSTLIGRAAFAPVHDPRDFKQSMKAIDSVFAFFVLPTRRFLKDRERQYTPSGQPEKDWDAEWIPVRDLLGVEQSLNEDSRIPAYVETLCKDASSLKDRMEAVINLAKELKIVDVEPRPKPVDAEPEEVMEEEQDEKEENQKSEELDQLENLHHPLKGSSEPHTMAGVVTANAGRRQTEKSDEQNQVVPSVTSENNKSHSTTEVRGGNQAAQGIRTI